MFSLCTGMPIWLTQRVLHTVCWDDTFLYVHTYSLLSPFTHSISSPFPFPPFLHPSLHPSIIPPSLPSSFRPFFFPSIPPSIFLPTPKILIVLLLVRSYLTGRTVRDQTVLCACPWSTLLCTRQLSKEVSCLIVVVWVLICLVPRLSHHPVFDCLQCAKTEGEGLVLFFT